MPVITVETVGSRATNISIDAPSQEWLFTASGSFDETEIRAAVEAELDPSVLLVSPLIFGSYPRTIVLQEYNVKQRDTGGWHWDGIAKYGRRQPRQTGDLILSFDSTGGTQHIVTSKEHMETYKRPSETEIPDFHNSIGNNGDTVEGCDITVPVFKFVYDWYPPFAYVTPAYIITLMRMTGQCNEEEWKGFQPGEALCLGVTGAPRGMDDWELKLHFLGSPDAVFAEGNPALPGLTVGEITGITKYGHDYLWVRFADSITAPIMAKVPQFVCTERVYDRKPFASLGIGV